jgi:hypothetical protein
MAVEDMARHRKPISNEFFGLITFLNDINSFLWGFEDRSHSEEHNVQLHWAAVREM